MKIRIRALLIFCRGIFTISELNIGPLCEAIPTQRVKTFDWNGLRFEATDRKKNHVDAIVACLTVPAFPNE